MMKWFVVLCAVAALSPNFGTGVCSAQDLGDDEAARAARLSTLRDLTTVQTEGLLSPGNVAVEPMATDACGASWTAVAVPSSGTPWQAVTWGEGLFVAVGLSGNISTSLDGVTWTPRNTGTSLELDGVVYGANAFIAVGKGATILRSPNGLTWSPITAPVASDLNDVGYGTYGFVAVGAAGTILQSSDGTTWSQRSSPTTKDLRGVGFGGNKYVVVGDSSTIVTSPDGGAWTTRTPPALGTLYSVAWSGSTFVVVGGGNILSSRQLGILTSSDGVTWADHSYFDTNLLSALNGVTWGSGVFVAVGFDLYDSNLYLNVLTSPDGLTWSPHYVQWSGRTLNAIAYGGGQFIAVGSAGTILRSVCDGGVQPVASFSWSPVNPTVGQTVQFTDTSTGPPTTWSWSFGDGSSSTVASPTHAYATPGIHSVTLQVGNAQGTASVTKSISVSSSGAAPVADFTWSPITPQAGQVVQLTDTSSGSPTAWSWSFNDGHTSTLQSPSHTFSSPGTYTASLTVSNSTGSSTKSKQVVVSSGGQTVTILSDNFEGSFPGSWHTSSSSTVEWGKVTCKSATGTGAAWCAAGGATPQTPCGQYTPNMNTWLEYGPFSLSDAIGASAEFDFWLDSETYKDTPKKGDRFWYLISVDGTNYSGYYRYGSTSGWAHEVFDLSDVTSFAAIGAQQVWFAFAFDSDASTQGGGAYVDNVVIKKVTAASGCAYSIAPASQSFVSSGGTGVVNVTMTSGSDCRWTTTSSASWITVTSGASGTGSGPVGFSVASNSGSARSGTLTIAGQTFTVNQAAATCTYSLSPSSANFSSFGGNGVFSVITSTGCSWTASTTAGWIHVITVSGSGTISANVAVDANAGSVRTGYINVQGQTFTVNQDGAAAAYAYWLPVANHVGGLNGSQWRSDLGLLNTGATTANAQVKLFLGGNVSTNATTVAPGVQTMLIDILGLLGVNGSGPIEILSDQPLKVTTRTYNLVPSSAACYANGTQGASYPALVASDGLSGQQSAYLAGLTENASYRCNVGLVNVGTDAATVLVELFNGAGTKLTDYTVTLPAGKWAQETQPYRNRAQQGGMDSGYAKITVQAGSGVFAFASVIDNITNDATTFTATP